MTTRFDDQELAELLRRNPDLGIEGEHLTKPDKNAGKLDRHTPADLNTYFGKGDGETEKELQAWSIDKLRENGWKVAHFRPAMTGRTYTNKAGQTKNVWVTAVQGDGAGFPDNIAVNPDFDYCLVCEVKATNGKLTPDQEKWLMAFSRLPGFRVIVLRPENKDEFLKLIKIEEYPTKQRIARSGRTVSDPD
ncbi:MAG: VRR-NUC domain-containing protein [Dehalococcoidales bacterium]|nr:VRR-NUC domain-containing protein [Dehalococcoidales bacterium]